MSRDAAERALEGFREAIDRTDRAILERLRERAGVVARVGEDKRSRGLSDIYRPGREAALLRRLVGAVDGPFPASSVVGVWREVIGASFAIEGRPLYVASHGPDAWERARAHFGPPATGAGAPAEVVEAVRGGGADVGVLALGDGADWWAGLPGSGVHVVARLPFAPEPHPTPGPDALVLAAAPPDPSGRDLAVAVSPRPAGEALAAAGGRFLVAVGELDGDMLGLGGYAAPLTREEVGL